MKNYKKIVRAILTEVSGCILTLALPLVPGFSIAATIYIDPTCNSNGDGTVGSPCATSRGAPGPRNTWVDVPWVAGNTYAGKGGTTADLTNLIVGASGTAGNPVTVTSYGNGRHVLNGNGSYAIALINRSYITFDNVEVRSNAQHGIYFGNTAASSDLMIRDCYFTTIVSSAIQFGESTPDTDFDNVTIINNRFERIGGSGIGNTPINPGSRQNWNNFTIVGNTFSNIGVSSANSAIDFLLSAGTSATMTNLTISGNVISQTNIGETATPAPAIRIERSPGATVPESRFSSVNVSNNTITTTDMGMITINNATAPSRIVGNVIYNLASNAAIAVFYSNGVEISGNRIRNIAPLAVSGYIDGMGIDLENNVNLSVHGNTISGNLGHSSHMNSGQGIYTYNDSGSLVFSNLLISNKHGIMSDAGVSATTFANNTIVNSKKYGIWASPFVSFVHRFINNIVTGSGEYGIFTAGTFDQILQTNLLFANTLGNHGSQILSGSDLTIDPLFVRPGNFDLQPASPAIGAGTWWGASCVDIRGRPCLQGRMALGAYQPSPDVIAPRAPTGLSMR